LKVIRQTDGTLIVKSSSLWIAGLCAIAAILLFGVGFALARDGTIAAGMIFLIFAVAWLRDSIWVFDATRGTARWSQMRFFAVSSGEIPFSEISEVLVQNASSGGGAVTYRLALTTSSGVMPLFDAYSGGQSKYTELRESIEQTLCAQKIPTASGPGDMHRES
jgi:outer membrane protein assembly factor BamB